MLRFDKLIAAVAAAGAAVLIVTPFFVGRAYVERSDNYKVDAARIERALRNGEEVSADDYEDVTAIREYDGETDIFSESGKYVVREANGKLYRIDYEDAEERAGARAAFRAEIIAAAVLALALGVLLYVRKSIVKPFDKMSELPLELAKGVPAAPLPETKSRYFGKYVWGMNMLREELEKTRLREMERVKKEKTLVLSLSHDIKTPLAAVKLYAEAIGKGIYADEERRRAAASSISEKVGEIERYVKEIAENSGAGSIEFSVEIKEFYQSEVVGRAAKIFADRFSAGGGELKVEDAPDCLLRADPDRLAEVLQNILDNALKYGDGSAAISFSDEEGCRLITVENGGCELPESELPHIFGSFWRGSNSQGKPGSGLGLYVCRRLMNDMLGEVFAEISDGRMKVSVVVPKAR